MKQGGYMVSNHNYINDYDYGDTRTSVQLMRNLKFICHHMPKTLIVNYAHEDVRLELVSVNARIETLRSVPAKPTYWSCKKC